MEKEIKKINIKTLTLALLLLGIAIGFSIRRCRLLSHSKYTIGTTVETFFTVPATKHVVYIYKVNHKTYKTDDYYNYNSKVPGGRYYVKFSSNDPSISKIYQDKPVPDSIKEAPPEGWGKIPGE